MSTVKNWGEKTDSGQWGTKDVKKKKKTYQTANFLVEKKASPAKEEKRRIQGRPPLGGEILRRNGGFPCFTCSGGKKVKDKKKNVKLSGGKEKVNHRQGCPLRH